MKKYYNYLNLLIILGGLMIGALPIIMDYNLQSKVVQITLSISLISSVIFENKKNIRYIIASISMIIIIYSFLKL